MNLYWIALKSILKKEINRFLRIWIQTLLPPVINITLYFIIFGNLLGSKIGKIRDFQYIEFIVPGLIMMVIINNAYSNVSSSFFSAKFQKNIEEILVAPIPITIVITGYVGGGIIRSILTGMLVMLISLIFVPIKIYNWYIIIIISILTAILFSLIGLFNALFAKNFDDISLIPTFILTPLIYLGGVFYSLQTLPVFWKKLSYLNPIAYMISAFRYGFLGILDFSLLNTIFVLVSLINIFYIIILYIIKNKNFF